MENSAGLDVEGFVAVDTTNKLIVVSFRGTCGLTSIRNDSPPWDPVPPTTFTCGTCGVVPGFYKAWLAARDIVMNSVIQQLGLHPGFTVVTTGHSLGGAISHYAGYELRINTTVKASVDLV
jgi:hypothetical protein